MADCFTCDSTRVAQISILSAFSFLAILFVLLRAFSRKIQKTVFEANDYLCVGGLVGTSFSMIFVNTDRQSIKVLTLVLIGFTVHGRSCFWEVCS